VARGLGNRGGVMSTGFRFAGFAARQPVAPNQKPDANDDPEGRQKNRRVSLIIQK
jgi:flagellar motor protein MotB